MGYRVVRKHDNIFSRFDTVPACDGRTDRRTDVQPISITCFSIADTRKNFLWTDGRRPTDGRTSETHFIRSIFRSRPKKLSKLELEKQKHNTHTVHCTNLSCSSIGIRDIKTPIIIFATPMSWPV